jgi:membrane protease YdiL (CAAX protease family)
MIQAIERKRIFIFLAFAFGISWATGLIIYLTGGLANSPVLTIAGGQFSLALVLMATFYMFGPALANILTRVVTREGKHNLLLKPNFDQGRWVHYLAAWVLPGILTIIGMVLFFLIFSGNFDANLSVLRGQLDLAGAGDMNPWLIVAVQTIQAILIAPLLNAIPTFGEEFGWRGYLQPKLMPLGGRKAILLTGIIWGVWHWPVILMGYNFGMDYFGAPFLGPLMMVWFTIVAGALLGWVTIKADSVWPAVIGHGALNGIAALSLLFLTGEPSTLLGPTPVGVIGGAGFTIIAVILFLSPNAFEPKLGKDKPQVPDVRD